MTASHSLGTRFGMHGWRSAAIAAAMLLTGADAVAAADLGLTDAERMWLQAHPVVRVGGDFFAPVTLFGDDGGPLDGVSAEYLAKAAESLGIRFELVLRTHRDHGRVMEALRNGEIDLVPHAKAADGSDLGGGAVGTTPYLEIPMVVVTRADDACVDGYAGLAGLRVAGPRPVFEDLRQRGIAATVEDVPPHEGLLGVATHRWDAYVGSLPMITHFLGEVTITNVKINGELPEPNHIVMAVRSEDAILARVLDKAFAAIPQAEKDAIWRRWFRVTYEEALVASPWLWGGVAMALLSLAFVLFQVRRLRRRVRKVEVAAESLDQHLMSAHLDAGATISEVTNALCRATGFAAAELIGRHLAEVGAPPVEAEADLGTLLAALRTGEAWTGELELRLKDGGALWASAVLSPRRRGSVTEGFTAVWQDITESRRYRELSLRDELTGLYNRRHFNAEAPQLLEAALREGKRLAVIALDVDNFKAYNDTYGHAAGDRVLAAIGDTLREGLRRETDHAFRLGGEEFAAVLAVAEKADAARIAEAVRELLQARAIPHAGNPHGVVTASIGVAVRGRDDPRDVDALLAAADAALYVAKRGGRNRVALAPPAPARETIPA